MSRHRVLDSTEELPGGRVRTQATSLPFIVASTAIGLELRYGR